MPFIIFTVFVRLRTKKNINAYTPTINGSKNIPVISCIGTARDGKSTLLDFYCHWITNKFNLEPKPKYPFIAKESDNESVTNGIDYYQVSDKCMLVDCQGMQLTNAKYDQHLSLICYLISNIIILTVRQRLDLQVLNNLLSMFSFLPQIEEQFRRKDKPKLIIRIKDSPYEKQLKNDSQFLNKIVNRWLEKSGDQYDVIKQAFRDAFEIYAIATQYPVDTNSNHSLDNDALMDIYDDKFPILNPSFVAACETICALSDQTVTSELMKNKELLENLVQALKTNPNIDYKKLDLYHNIIACELLEYSRNHILVHPFIDQSICDKMDGSSQAHAMYQDRLEQINELKYQTLYVKFKDVPEEMKREKLDREFIRITEYVDTAKTKNIMIAEDNVLPHWQTFRKKFDGTEIEKMVQGFIEIFADREKVFLKKLEKIDCTVRSKYIDLLEKERDDLEKKQQLIISKNMNQMCMINDRISEYQMDHYVKLQIQEHIDNINTVNMLYNQNVKILETKIRGKIIDIIKNIYEDLNYIRYLSSDHNIWKQLQPATTQDINFIISKYSKLLDRPGFIEYYNDALYNRLMTIGFLKDVNYASIPGIQFIEFVMGNEVYCMVEQFYLEKFQIVLDQVMEKHPYIDIEENGYIKNVQKVSAVLKTHIMSHGIDPNKRIMVKEMLQYVIVEKIIRFCHTNGLQIV